MIFESNEEKYFQWWLEEVKETGYIDTFKLHPKVYSLSENIEYSYEETKHLKTKTKFVKKRNVLLKSHIYTPDFGIRWNEKAKFIFYIEPDGNTSYRKIPMVSKTGGSNVTIVETKGTFDQNNMTRLFTINQKWVYDKFGEYVQLIKIPDFFNKTFYPKRYLMNDSGTKPRKKGGKALIEMNLPTIKDFIKKQEENLCHSKTLL